MKQKERAIYVVAAVLRVAEVHRAAFQAHTRTQHFADFEATVAPMTPEKSVTICRLIS